MTTTAKARSIAFLSAMLLVSVALNVGLAFKVRQFTQGQADQLARMEALRLKAGTAVPLLTAKLVGTNEGVRETINYGDTDRPTVLYVLSPTCGWCAKNESSIKHLIAKKSDEYRFVAITLVEQGAAEFQAAHPLAAPLYTGLSEDAQKAYKMGGTPQTIVISPQGVVLANWNGAYLGRQKSAIEKFFKVELPDIIVEKRSQAPGA